MRTLLLCLALIPSVGHAQPAEPPPTPAPPAPPPAEAPPPPPAPPPSPADACRARRHELEDQAAHATDLQQRARILQSLPDCSHPDAAAPPPAPVVETTTNIPPAVEAATGVAIELQMETALVQTNTTPALSLPQPGIFIGYRLPGATLGVGLDFERAAQSTELSGASMDASTTSFLILPGVRLPLAHSTDGRTELLGRVDAGYGQQSSSNNQSSGDAPAIQHIRLQAAPALRFWVSRSFAVGAAVGVRYDWLNQDTSVNGMQSGNGASTLALFSSFYLVGVF